MKNRHFLSVLCLATLSYGAFKFNDNQQSDHMGITLRFKAIKCNVNKDVVKLHYCFIKAHSRTESSLNVGFDLLEDYETPSQVYWSQRLVSYHVLIIIIIIKQLWRSQYHCNTDLDSSIGSLWHSRSIIASFGRIMFSCMTVLLLSSSIMESKIRCRKLSNVDVRTRKAWVIEKCLTICRVSSICVRFLDYELHQHHHGL